jgi:hypothetical protein
VRTLRNRLRGGARAGLNAVGDLIVVSGEDFVGDSRCCFGLPNERIAGRFAASTVFLRSEDDVSREPLAAPGACDLGEHRQTDGDPENGHDRQRDDGRQEPASRTGCRAWRTNAPWTIDVRVPQDSLLRPPQASNGR